MQQRDAVRREDVLREVVRHLGRRLEVDLLRLLDQRIDDVGLPARVELLADEVVDLVAPRLGLGDRLDRQAARRQLADHRDVEIAVGRQRERARNRRRGHHEDVGVQPLGAQRRALQHAEAMLLVDDDQPELAERDVILHERVRADDQVERAAGELRLRLAALPRRRARRSAAPRGSATTPAAANVDEVLLRQDLGRRHERDLEAVLHRDERRQQRDDRLARTDVALQQPVHRLRPLHVVDDLLDRPSSDRRSA